jgi:hypothetical protein
MTIRCIQVGTTTVQGDLVSTAGDQATIKVGSNLITGTLTQPPEPQADPAPRLTHIHRGDD